MTDDKLTVTWDELEKHQPLPSPGTTVAPVSQNLSDHRPTQRRRALLLYCITGLVVVAGGIGITAWVMYANNARSIAAIERVLKEDTATTKGAKTAAEVTARMKDIDLADCPEDFIAAYTNHIDAWETQARVERNIVAHQEEAGSVGTFVESFIRGFLGDIAGKTMEVVAEQNRLKKEYQAAAQQVEATFKRVKEITVSHGARLPRQ